jgi:hypothetical protein
MEAAEAGCEVAAAEEGADGGDRLGAQRPHGTAVVLFVAGEEIVPGVINNLPEGRGARAARVVDRGHERRWEHSSGQRRRAQECRARSTSGADPMTQPESDLRGTVLILMRHVARHAQVREAISRIVAVPMVEGQPLQGGALCRASDWPSRLFHPQPRGLARRLDADGQM